MDGGFGIGFFDCDRAIEGPCYSVHLQDYIAFGGPYCEVYLYLNFIPILPYLFSTRRSLEAHG